MQAREGRVGLTCRGHVGVVRREHMMLPGAARELWDRSNDWNCGGRVEGLLSRVGIYVGDRTGFRGLWGVFWGGRTEGG